LDRIELELARLREKRPALSDRIDRATNLLVVHLSCPRQRVIRVRVHDGGARFLVASQGSGGAVYGVDRADWTCSCPDHHRRDRICKHGLACYILWRASRPVPTLSKCDGCSARLPRGEMIELHEDNHDNLTYFHGDLLCAGCADGVGVAR